MNCPPCQRLNRLKRGTSTLIRWSVPLFLLQKRTDDGPFDAGAVFMSFLLTRNHFNVMMIDMKFTKRTPPSASRAYRQGARAERTRANERAVLDAAVSRLRMARRLADVTLEEIAQQAGVTVRTILRQYGSKDGIMEAAFLEVGRQVKAARPKTPAGDVDAALGALLTQYEI